VFVGAGVSVEGPRVSGGNGDKVSGCSIEDVVVSVGDMVVGNACPQASRTDPSVTAPIPAAATLRKLRLEYLPILTSFQRGKVKVNLNQDCIFFSGPVFLIILDFVFPLLLPVGFFAALL
jgi:hypothetical protein